MGSTPSKPAQSALPTVDEKQRSDARLTTRLASVTLGPRSAPSTGEVHGGAVESWASAFEHDAVKQLAATVLRSVASRYRIRGLTLAISGQDYLTAMTSRKARIADTQIFNHRIPHDGTPRVNQVGRTLHGEPSAYMLTAIVRTVLAVCGDQRRSTQRHQAI
jgi:hypothetical protein